MKLDTKPKIEVTEELEYSEIVKFLAIFARELTSKTSPELAFLNAYHDYDGPLKDLIGGSSIEIYQGQSPFEEGWKKLQGKLHVPELQQLFNALSYLIDKNPQKAGEFLAEVIPNLKLIPRKTKFWNILIRLFEYQDDLQKTICPRFRPDSNQVEWMYIDPKSPDPLDNYEICILCKRGWKIIKPQINAKFKSYGDKKGNRQNIKVRLSKLGFIKEFEGIILLSTMFYHKLFSLNPYLMSYIVAKEKSDSELTTHIENGIKQIINLYDLPPNTDKFLVAAVEQSPLLGLG